MIVHLPTKHLVLNLGHPGKVVGVVPGAKLINLRGHDLVAVPHHVDTSKMLLNMGIKAPSPIEYHYEFPHSPGKPPMAHQKTTAGFLTLHQRGYVLNEMGTAKTLSVLWAAHYLRSIGKIDAIVVVAPLSTLERTWGDEIFSNFFDLTFSVLHGDQAKRIQRMQAQHDIYIINHDGIKSKAVALAMQEHLIKRYGKDRILFVIDETDAYTNSGSDRWEATNILIAGCPWVWGLSGSPTPTAPTDAWAQCRLITPWTVPPYFSRFRNRVMTKITNFKWAAKEDALQEVHRVMQPAIRFTRKECFDLPPMLSRFEHVELTPEQKKLYKAMLDKSKVELENGEIVALNEGVKLQKLVQIACGVMYDGEDENYHIPVGPRVGLVKDLVRRATSKVILFVPITGALDMIAAELAKDNKLVVVDGRVSATARNERFSQFANDPDTNLLVAQPGTMSHGLNMQHANTIIWYCPTNSNRVFTQANDRIPRPGQKNDMFIIKLEGTHVEREMYKRLEAQGTMQGALLAAYERQRTEA